MTIHHSNKIKFKIFGGSSVGKTSACRALQDMAGEQKDMIYDATIDNTPLSIADTAKQILAAFKACQNPEAFKKLHKGNLI